MISWGSKLLLYHSHLFQKLTFKKNSVQSVTSVCRNFASFPVIFEAKSRPFSAASKLFEGVHMPWQLSVRTTTRGKELKYSALFIF